jgi:hypothetical protein
MCSVLQVVVCPFNFEHCVVCPLLIYGLWLPILYLQARLAVSYIIDYLNISEYRENILTTYVIDYLSAIAHISWYILMGKFMTRCYKWINIPCDSHKPAVIMCLKRLSTFNDSTSNIIQYFSSVKKRRAIQFKSDKGTQSTLTINRWIYIPITYTVCWYTTLYQVEPVVWVSITTSRDSDE